jgi:adenosylcobinamide-GDP ribazoletransferase
MDERLHGLAADLKVGVLFATRIPLAHAAAIEGQDIARAAWALPVIGILIGLIGALTYWLAVRFGLPAWPAAGLALAATMAVTGCLHEDGLADTFDGLGGADRERSLAIMRDSRIGTYGAAALAVTLLLRAGAIASLPGPARVAWALIAAHAGARALLPLLMRAVPAARLDGLAAEAGRPPPNMVAVAALIGVVVLIVALGVAKAIIATLLLLVAFGIMRRLSLRQIGGQTGDVAGALEQIGEVVILLVAAAGA